MFSAEEKKNKLILKININIKNTNNTNEIDEETSLSIAIFCHLCLFESCSTRQQEWNINKENASYIALFTTNDNNNNNNFQQLLNPKHFVSALSVLINFVVCNFIGIVVWLAKYMTQNSATSALFLFSFLLARSTASRVNITVVVNVCSLHFICV